MIKHYQDGDIITADWNALVQVTAPAMIVNGKRVLTTDDLLAVAPPVAPSLLTLASVAATAAAVSTPISRRRLLRFWRG